MKATLSSLPPDDGNWAYEIKWDGYRTIAFVADGHVRLQSTNRLDATANYPEIGDLPTVSRPGGRSSTASWWCSTRRPASFELFQRHELQATYYIFDVLSIDGHDTIELPYEDRRRLSTDLVEPGATGWCRPIASVTALSCWTPPSSRASKA